MILLHIFEQSFVFLPFSLGVFVSYSLLNKADLTVEGSFVLGAAVYGLTVLAGGAPALAMLLALSVGFLSGGVVSLLQYRDQMPALISGILALFMLQSVNLGIMGRPNLNLLGQSNMLHVLDFFVGARFSGPITVAAVSLIFFLLLLKLLYSRIGLLLRAFGDNSSLMNLMGHKLERVRFFGLGLSNALVALSGALTAQYQGYVDVGMGVGNVLIGIGTVIIGQQSMEYFMRGRCMTVFMKLSSCLLGVFIYFATVNYLIAFGVNPIYLKLAIGALIATLLFCNPPRQLIGGV